MSKHRQAFEKAYLSRGILRSLEEWALRNGANVETAVQRHVNVKKTLSENILLPIMENILDVGCGSGFFLRRLLVECNPLSLCGIDISKFQLENASINCPPANLICSCAENLPFKNEAFQNIVCSEVLEHVINPGKTLREITRVLRINGKVGISTPNPSSFFMKFLHFYFKIRRVEDTPKDEPIDIHKLISMLPKDLEVQKKVFINPFPLLPSKGIFKSKLVAKLIIKLSHPLQRIPMLNSKICDHYIIIAKRNN